MREIVYIRRGSYYNQTFVLYDNGVTKTYDVRINEFIETVLNSFFRSLNMNKMEMKLMGITKLPPIVIQKKGNYFLIPLLPLDDEMCVVVNPKYIDFVENNSMGITITLLDQKIDVPCSKYSLDTRLNNCLKVRHNYAICQTRYNEYISLE